MITVTIDIKGLNKGSDYLGKIKDKLKNKEYALKKVSEYLKDFYSKDVFASEGSVYGTRWAALAPSTAAEKSRSYPGRGILERTGELKRSFRFTTSKDALQISNPVLYARYHQTGTSRMPQRVILDMKSEQAGKIASIIIREIMESIKK
jgi:phage gpG-like protein